MRPEVRKADSAREFSTPERCHIIEIANDDGDEQVSIARARVEPGVTTAWHRLAGIGERYLIVSGRGQVQLGEQGAIEVEPGDVVRIPAGTAQRIANTGGDDLVFYAICSPPFRYDCYEALE
ncbi:MAG: cupin domain-containing protein [Gammaproteobacteria bacterium]|jgi:mannose-6-phosphate isomerase-like protein (cupin superfamily)